MLTSASFVRSYQPCANRFLPRKRKCPRLIDVFVLFSLSANEVLKTHRINSLSTEAVVKSREKRQLYGNNSIQVANMYSFSSYNNVVEKSSSVSFLKHSWEFDRVENEHICFFVAVSEFVFFRTTTNITRHSLLKTGDTYGQTSGTELEACEMIICPQAISL